MNDDDDIELHGYQDDFDNKFTDIDPFMDETGDDPLKEFRVPQEEFKEELDKLAFDEAGDDESDDMREMMEDRDEADDNAASTS